MAESKNNVSDWRDKRCSCFPPTHANGDRQSYLQTDRAAVVHNNVVFILFISFAAKFSFAFVFKKKNHSIEVPSHSPALINA